MNNYIHLHSIFITGNDNLASIDEKVGSYCNLIAKCKLKDGVHFGFLLKNKDELPYIRNWIIGNYKRSYRFGLNYAGMNTIPYSAPHGISSMVPMNGLYIDNLYSANINPIRFDLSTNNYYLWGQKIISNGEMEYIYSNRKLFPKIDILMKNILMKNMFWKTLF